MVDLKWQNRLEVGTDTELQVFALLRVTVNASLVRITRTRIEVYRYTCHSECSLRICPCKPLIWMDGGRQKQTVGRGRCLHNLGAWPSHVTD